MANLISTDQRFEYFKRLIEPYEKGNEKKFFIMQYVKGAGNEMYEKFWSEKSSSRMAFDLYSWLGQEKNAKDFSFEYHLPPLASGGMGPNMDVFIETEDEIIFIESKFSELASLDYKKKENLSPAYYADKHGKKEIPYKDRYYNLPNCEKIRDFIDEMDEFMSKYEGKKDWFDAKQETCHLVGIYLYCHRYLTKNKKKKKIRFYNIFWKLDGDEVNSEIRKKFEDLFKKYRRDLFDGMDIEFNAFTVQELCSGTKNISNHLIFSNQNINLSSYEEISKGKSRIEMSKL